MNGYWVGNYTGSNVGRMVIELDDRGDHFEGCAYPYDSNPSLPNTFAVINTVDKSNQGQFIAPLIPLHPHTGEPTEWQQIAKLYSQGVNVPTKADVTYQWNAQSLSLSWRTDIGTSGSTILNAAQPSALLPLPIKTSYEFRKYVTQLDDRRYIFRGQNKPLRLRTPFHRTGRGDMRRYLIEDIPVLHRHLSARTRHFFNLTNPLENAAFLHLIQHHGYPTPLLDWTYSPYIAAYFAYHRIKSSEAAIASEDQKVRIFVFDKVRWCAAFQQILNVSARWEHFSILEPLAIENERLVPQQALSTFTTVDDIESYIDLKEEERNAQYLQVIDLPMSERDDVVRELRLMGITAGSLFPGLDGACEELKDRFFRL